MTVGPSGSPQVSSAWPLRALLVIAAVWLLREARPLLLPVALAMVFAFALAAPVRALRRRGIGAYVGAALVLGVLLATLALLGWWLATPALEWWAQLPSTLQGLFEALQRWRALFAAALGGQPAEAVATVPTIAERLASEGLSIGRLALGEVLSFALQAAATVMLLYFLLAAEEDLLAFALDALPRHRTRLMVRDALGEAQRDIGLFLGMMSWINFALGAATGLAVAAIGLPNPLLWAMMTALLAFVPYLGPAAAAVALLLAGNVAFGAGWHMLAPPAAFLALHAVEANLLSPLLMGRRLRLSPVFVFVSVLAWGWLWGVAGAFMAVPLLLGLRTVCRRARRLRWFGAWLEGGRPRAGGTAAV